MWRISRGGSLFAPAASSLPLSSAASSLEMPSLIFAAFAVRACWNAVTADEIWVHCSWTFPVWYGALLARLFGKKLVVVPEGSFDPKRLHNHARWKKRLVAPLDRWVLRKADEVLALCKDEINWIEGFEPSARVRFEHVPLFIKEDLQCKSLPRASASVLHVLFLGRAEDPLKGVRFLEAAVAEIESKSSFRGEHSGVELRVVRDHFGEELEKDWQWCDVLCLPTLSENFGLVVAEALERGKFVVTTDGAPAWADLRPDQGIYLKGYRDGSPAERVALLRGALENLVD